MNGCNYIKKRIDEAEKPDVLPFDVSEHIGQCGECERFATERTALRQLLAAGTRVNAPINFDAVLKARLAETKDRGSFWWLGSPAFLRLGAATAGVAVMLVVAQYTGLFPNDGAGRRNGSAESEVASRTTPKPDDRTQPTQTSPSLTPDVVATGGRHQGYYKAQRVRRGDVPVDPAVAGYMTAEDGGVVLVRGRNGDVDVQMPTVSVGAQPLLYVSAGQRNTRSVGTSF